MFIDLVRVKIKAGDGGNGMTAWRREKGVPFGGPAGGDGGKGGSVIFVANSKLSTLLDFKYKHQHYAPDGEHGHSKNMHGRDGEDLIINVPVGTVISNKETQEIITDLNSDGMEVVILNGGKGGRGNTFFATSRHQAPEFAELGQKTKPLEIVLELKLLADVGLVGFPNVGKSTFLSKVSSAKPKIANYEFTTLVPNLGIVEHENNKFVMADLPGLIKGAHLNHGLGEEFLRHIERTKTLIHVVDITKEDPIQSYRDIRYELEMYGNNVDKKKEIIVLNKDDFDEHEEIIKKFKETFSDSVVIEASFVIEKNIDKILSEINKILNVELQWQVILFKPNNEHKLYKYNQDDRIVVYRKGKNEFVVEGDRAENIVNKYDLKSIDALHQMSRKLKKVGVFKILEEQGIKNQDIITISGFKLVYYGD